MQLLVLLQPRGQLFGCRWCGVVGGGFQSSSPPASSSPKEASHCPTFSKEDSACAPLSKKMTGD